MAISKEKFLELLGEEVDNRLNPVVKGFEDRLGALEEVSAQPIHSKTTGVIDDGILQEVGHGMYKLPGGSVVCPAMMWGGQTKSFHKAGGLFVSLGKDAKDYMTEIKEKCPKGITVSKAYDNIVEKATDISSVMRGTDDSSAGMFIPEDVRYAMLQFSPPGTIVWPRAQVWPMTTDKIQWPKLVQDPDLDSAEFFGNMTLTWTEEGGEKTVTRPQFTTLALECFELSAYTVVTDILLQDSAINIGNLLVQLFQGAYWHYTDRQFLQGWGNTRPLGVLNDPGVYTQNRIEANKVNYEDLVNMSVKLPPMFDNNAVWFMGKEAFGSLRKQKDDNGQPVIQLGQGYNDFGEGVAGFALGYPIVLADYKVSRIGSTGDVVLGDWKHYFIGERKTLSVEMSRHAEFQNNRTAFRANARLGGTPEEPKAFVVLQATADASLS